MISINKKNSKIIVSVVLLLTMLQVVLITQLKFNYDFESFFSASDEETKYYFDYRKNFENDTDYCLIGIENKEGVFKADFLKKVDSLCADLKALKHMEAVRSITNSKTFIVSSLGIRPIELIHDDYSRLHDDSLNVFANEELIGTFVSKDAKALTIYVKKENMVPCPNSEGTIKERETNWMNSVEETVSKYSFDEMHLAGRIKAENYYVGKMQWEVMLFVSLSFIMIVLFLFIAFRTLWGIILPMIVVLFSVIWAMGFMSMSGQKIDVMTVLLPTMMFVVGMSDVVHIVTRYLQELRIGKEKAEAIKVTLKDVGLATFLTSLTTAVGFLTLMTTSITPIRNFGLFTSIGVVWAFILAYSFLPAMLFLLKTPKVDHESEARMFWSTQLHSIFIWILRKKKAVLFAGILIAGISIWGVSKIEVNAQLIDEVEEGDPLKDDFVFFERYFSGVRPFEVSLELGKGAKSINDYEVLKEIEKIENFLKEKCQVNQVTSPVTVFKVLNRAMNNGLPEHYVMPGKQNYAKSNKMMAKYKKVAEVGFFTSPDKKLGRLTGIVTDIGSKRSKEIKDDFDVFIKENINKDLVKPRITGSAFLIDNTNDQLSINMMQGLCFSFLVIGIIMGLIFKSFKMILISFIPNIIPLLMIGAIIGFTGIGMKMSTSIIFTIAFGIAVDDTIHFMSKFKIELAKGRSYLYAIKRTFISTGKAIIVTSIILVSGFLMLMLSDFNGTFYVGLLISLTLLFAVIADLFLIPVLLIYMVNKKQIEKMRGLFINFKK